MSTPCTTCGEPLAPADDRCPTCGALASPPDGTVAAVAAGDPNRADDAPPWSIPIREPAAVARSATNRKGMHPVALGAIVLGVLLVVVTVGALVLGGGSDGSATAARDAEPDPAGTDEATGLDPMAVDRETTTTSGTATTTTETTAPATTTTAAPVTTVSPATVRPAPTTTVAAARTGPNGTGSVPALSTSFRGWLAQLTSVPYDAGTDGLADEWQRLRGAAPGAVTARSDDWSAFRDGFWVLVDPGPFSSADEVRAFCAAAGFAGDDACLPRELRG